ncbi:O-antigen ligase family protein [Paenibacillus popilliae]|uniref:O-antigen ligase domain-containing protein n=1 Tax=Paenibacillus popilliae TaxID=78057 RepID=A0ABY3ARJ2_PAEPP|nr:O-antigen ligase family protein [Paenibacillus sp. SDF0028]TQR43703.1 O-antigen ligase domain-containing protein [Paenibacillus sp. SDF0028]
MSSYGYSRTKSSGNNISASEWSLFGLLALILIWAPFQAALFNGQMSDFDSKIYYSVLLTSVLALIGTWSVVKSKLLIDNKMLVMLGSFLTPLCYLTSLTISASKYLAENMVLIQFVYAVIFALSVLIIQNKLMNGLIEKIIIGSAYVIVLFGLFHWFHTTKWIGILFGWFMPVNSEGVFQHAVMETVDGLRLTSVFQYANTYAAYLMAFLFIAVFYLTTTRKVVWQVIHGFMLVPIILSILLTLSRGGLVLLPVVFVIVLLFLKPARQIMWLVHLAISSVATFVILNKVSDIGNELQNSISYSLSMKGWLYLLGASVICTIISFGLQRFISPWLEQKLETLSLKKWANALIPLGGTVIVALLLFLFIGTSAKNMLPENIATRLETINFQQHSVLERITFYKDSMKLVADYPLFGAGGGAWAALYAKYENNPYDIQQAHSFYMQYLVETGIIGILILMALLIYIYISYIRSFIKATEEKRDSHFLYFILATSILVHSVMDFNMSFVYIGILVFLCLGGMIASIESKPIGKLKPKTFRILIPSILGIVGIGLFITSILFVQASSSFASAKETVLTTQDFNKTMDQLRKAKSIRSTHPEYAAFEANLYMSVYQQQKDDQFFTEAEKVLKNALGDNPHNKSLLLQLIKLYNIKGLDEQVYAVYSQNASNFPWDMKWYEEYMDKALREGYKSITTAPDKKGGYLNEVIAAFEHVKAGVEHLKTLPKGQLQGNPFYVTSSMAMNAGRAYVMKGDPAKAAETMKPYLQEDLTNSNDPENSPENNRELARWYVAATIQQGRVDQIWYDKLVALGSDQKEQIDQITGMRFKAE